MNRALDDPDRRRSHSLLQMRSAAGRSRNRNLLEALGEHLIRGAGPIRSAYGTRDRMRHTAIMRFDIKSVTLPASAFDFD
jgi:hypothetical protein